MKRAAAAAQLNNSSVVDTIYIGVMENPNKVTGDYSSDSFFPYLRIRVNSM